MRDKRCPRNVFASPYISRVAEEGGGEKLPSSACSEPSELHN